MNSIKYSIYFLLVIAKNTKPLLPFPPNLSIYLSGMQLAVHILLSGLDYDEPLRDIRGGDFPVCLADWYFATSTVHSWWTVITTHRWSITICPYPKIVVLIQQICWYDVKICLSFTIFPQLLMTLWEKNIIKGRYWSIDYVTLSSFVMYFLSKRNLKKYMIWYHLSLSFSRFIIFH